MISDESIETDYTRRKSSLHQSLEKSSLFATTVSNQATTPLIAQRERIRKSDGLRLKYNQCSKYSLGLVPPEMLALYQRLPKTSPKSLRY